MKPLKDIVHLANDKKVASEIVARCLKNEQDFQELLTIFFDSNNRMNQYASNPLSKIAEVNSDRFIPLLPKLIANLDNPAHKAIVRNTVRLWQFMEIPEEYEGEIYDRCYQYLTDVKEDIAIRVFSMTVMANIAEKYIELQEEVVQLIRMYYEDGSAGFKSRGRKILARFN